MAQTPLPVPATLNLNNIQGDILSGLPKKTETWYFFQIVDPTDFRRRFRNFIPYVKSVAQVLKDRDDIEKHKRKHDQSGTKPHLIPLVGVNVAFSHFGLDKIGVDDKNLVDTAFMTGQRIDAGATLGDKGTSSEGNFDPDWDPAFKNEIHGVFIIAGDSHGTVEKKVGEIEKVFGVGAPSPSIKEVARVRGDSRPGDLSAHEHFGYLDGVSNPAVIGFGKNPNPGPAPVRPGAVILGHEGDKSKDKRDGWMVDGSFLVFRYLFQRVPEFDDFLDRNALKVPGLSHKEGTDLLGARLVGRWKSGAPIDLTPFRDDPNLANDPQRINNFSFAAERDFQKLCPFASHIRKTLPRADLEDLGISLGSRRIMRRGIQFGPEVTKQEKRDKRTYHARGLLFACYQSSITDGFQFIQKSWANSATFPFAERAPEVPGLDALIGQGPDRKLSGTDPNDPTKELILPDEWVVPRGGEYFFSPSLKGMKDAIALSA
ncbi:peroxidase TAP [Cyathus striatus]|nr:peroxidase TAP [Cyathus striatus]